MKPEREIRIEGYTPDELLAALDEETEALLFSGEPLVFRAGTATVLGQLRRVLERRGFVVRDVPGKGECYHQIVGVEPSSERAVQE